MKQQFFKEWVICAIICTMSLSVFGQNRAISLEEALNIARNNYAGLERDRLTIDQYNKLASTGLPVQPTQLYISGEEFGSNGQTGVHSLNVFQNFYLPKVSKAQRDYYRQGAVVAEKQLQLTDWELKRQVEQAFYQLQYVNEALVLVAENVSLYDDFLTVTTAQLKTGETGRCHKWLPAPVWDRHNWNRNTPKKPIKSLCLCLINGCNLIRFMKQQAI